MIKEYLTCIKLPNILSKKNIKDKLKHLCLKIDILKLTSCSKDNKNNDLKSLEELSGKFGYSLIKTQKELEELLKNYYFSSGLLTFDFSKKYNILPLDSTEKEKEDKILKLAINDPYDYELLDRISTLLNQTSDKKILFHLARLDNIKAVLKKIEDGDIGEKEIDRYSLHTLSREIQKNISGQIDIIKLVGQIILKAYEEGASDVHIEPYEDRVEVRFRVDGVLRDGLGGILPKEKLNELVARIKILADMDIAEKRKPQDARIKSNKVLEHLKKSVKFDLRVSTFPTVNGEKVVMRILKKEALKGKLNELHMPSKVQNILEEKITTSQGFILISGPTGSGKTTTLYSALASIDKDTKNILTIEDPVEYQLEGVYQMQVNHKIGVTFAKGLKTTLRQDPDVIMVGEIRDEETAQIAIQASLTGHLVFSTIHTNDAVGIITRLLEMNIKSYLIADSLSLAMAQRLVRKICKTCTTTKSEQEMLNDLVKYKINGKDELEKLLGFELKDLQYKDKYPYGSGKVLGGDCPKCKGEGYDGRDGIYGYVNINKELKELLHSKEIPTRGEIERVTKDDRQTLLESAKDKLIAKVTTIEEIVRVLVQR